MTGTPPLDALGAPIWPCHGYQNCCACFRCADRAARLDALLSQGMDFPDACEAAAADSAEWVESLAL